MRLSAPLRHFALCSNLAVAALLAALLAVTGCPRRPDRLAREAPLRTEGVPVIRVRVAAAPAMTIATSGPYRITVDGRTVAAAGDPLPATTLQRRNGAFALLRGVHPGRTLTVAPAGRGRVRLGGVAYRGTMVFIADPAAGMIAVNHVNVESYLAGVLPRELYPNWAEATSQVYGGFSAETDRSWRAVHKTHGLVLGTGRGGQERLFRAHYSSCCGGRTNPVTVLYGPAVTAGPLAGGVLCNDCRACSRYSWPPVRISKDVIHKALAATYPRAAELQAVRTVRVVSEFQGRPVWLDVVGPGGKEVRVRAQDLRLALLRRAPGAAKGLYSMNCRIRDDGDAIVFDWGKGFGHGVGLCQWGAQGKALRGWSAEQILANYYPGSRLFRAYR